MPFFVDFCSEEFQLALHGLDQLPLSFLPGQHFSFDLAVQLRGEQL
jgi:hypothetical protein